MRALAVCLLLLVGGAAFAAAPAPVRLLLSVGSNLGSPEEPPLQHAEDDARRFRDLFVELGGVEPSRALVIEQATASKVTERFAELQGRVAELKAAGHRVELIVFASAHGKAQTLRLTGSELKLDELRALTRSCAADLTITFVDACEAGSARQKGATKGPAYALSVQPAAVSGEVFIASSGATEGAQEWDVLAGSLFTHHLLSGLRGDADADEDGQVSLMESYGYAARRTVANSADRGQHPEFAVALQGQSDVVLTGLGKGRARVVLDHSMEGRFVLVSQPRPDVVAEVVKAKGRSVTLAVPPGRYLLRQSRGFTVALQDVELPWGGVATVDPRRFVTHDYTEVALKGGDVGLRPHALQLTGAFATAPIEATPARWSVGLGYRFASGRFFASLSAGWGQARFRGVELTTRDDRFGLSLAAGARFWLGPVTLMPGVAVEGSLLRQHSLRDREEEIRRSYPALPVRFTPGFAVGPQLRAELPVVGPLFVAATATAWVRWLSVAELPMWTVGADGQLAIGVKL